MRRDMHKGCMRCCLDECIASRAAVEQCLRIGKQRADSPDLIFDKRRLVVGNSDQRWDAVIYVLLFEAILEHGCARGIRDFEAIDEMPFAVEESVERQQVQRPMRDDRDLWRLNSLD